MLRRGVSEKVFRGGQSGGEVLWRKRSKDCVAVVTDGGFCECPPWIVSSAAWVPSTGGGGGVQVLRKCLWMKK